MVEIHWVLLLSGLAACVRYAQQFTGEKDTRPSWEWGVASIHAGTGAFAGLIAAWAVGKVEEIRYVWLAIAFAGYGGKLTLDAGWEIMRSAASTIFARAAQRLADKDVDKGPKG